MIKLKLCKGLSYSGIVSATKKSPFVDVETREKADEVVATGYFEIIGSSAPETDQENENTDEQANLPFEENDQENENTDEQANLPFEENDQENDQEESQAPHKPIGDMKTAELEDYALELGLDLSECTNNDQRRALIKAALED